jgi:hypothetical protein
MISATLRASQQSAPVPAHQGGRCGLLSAGHVLASDGFSQFVVRGLPYASTFADGEAENREAWSCHAKKQPTKIKAMSRETGEVHHPALDDGTQPGQAMPCARRAFGWEHPALSTGHVDRPRGSDGRGEASDADGAGETGETNRRPQTGEGPF